MKYMYLHIVNVIVHVVVIIVIGMMSHGGILPSVYIPVTLLFATISIILLNIHTRKAGKND